MAKFIAMETTKHVCTKEQQRKIAASKSVNHYFERKGNSNKRHSSLAIQSIGMLAIYITPLILISVLETSPLEAKVDERVRAVNYIALSETPCEPETVAKKIEAVPHRHAILAAANLHIEIKGRKAVLSGYVRSLAEKKEAERAAWSSPWITAVDNQIKVNLSFGVH